MNADHFCCRAGTWVIVEVIRDGVFKLVVARAAAQIDDLLIRCRVPQTTFWKCPLWPGKGDVQVNWIGGLEPLWQFSSVRFSYVNEPY